MDNKLIISNIILYSLFSIEIKKFFTFITFLKFNYCSSTRKTNPMPYLSILMPSHQLSLQSLLLLPCIHQNYYYYYLNKHKLVKISNLLFTECLPIKNPSTSSSIFVFSALPKNISLEIAFAP